MAKSIRCTHRWLGALILAVAAACPSAAWAGSDYSDKDFAVRMPPAFIRFREVSTAGGETVANRWSSAINPASADWSDLPCELGVVIAPYYRHVRFQEGTELNLYAESVTWDTGAWGTIQPTISQIRSNEETDRMGLEFDYTVDVYQVQWGKRWGNFGLGANFNYARGEVVQKMGPLRVGEGDADSYRFRLGALYEPCEKWLTGIAVEYGWAPTRTTITVPTPFGLLQMKDEDTQRQIIVRPGVSYEYAPRSTVYVDYQYGRYYNDDLLNSHRWSVGVDHHLTQVMQGVFVRGGISADARGNTGFSCGIGAYLSPAVAIDVGYQYDMLPELRPEFGRSQALQLVVSVRF